MLRTPARPATRQLADVDQWGIESKAKINYESATKAAAKARKLTIFVIEIRQVGIGRTQVIAVLGTSDTRLAMSMGDGDKRGLTVNSLNWKQRANTATPAAFALKERTHRQGCAECDQEQTAECNAILVKNRFTARHKNQKEANRNQVTIFLHPFWRRPCL